MGRLGFSIFGEWIKTNYLHLPWVLLDLGKSNQSNLVLPKNDWTLSLISLPDLGSSLVVKVRIRTAYPSDELHVVKSSFNSYPSNFDFCVYSIPSFMA